MTLHIKNKNFTVPKTQNGSVRLNILLPHLTVRMINLNGSLCAPDDYDTERGAQRLFDHPV